MSDSEMEHGKLPVTTEEMHSGEEGSSVGMEINPKYRTPWRYTSPLMQVIIVSFVAFTCPGLYNALSGIGGSGQLDTTVSANGNIALTAVSTVGNLLIAPVVYAYIGPRWIIFLGGITYPLYGGSLLAYNHIESGAFVIATGAILGLGASFLWIGQGVIMTAMPLPSEKGRMVGMFWFIFNLGGVIGSFISVGLNWKSTLGSVSDATYAVFIALMVAGFLLALALLPPSRIVRTDGTRVHVPHERPNVARDFVEILKIIPRKESLVCIPYFMMANYFYSYQQNTVNARLFDIRTRSFNGAMYWFAQMITAALFGSLLDMKRFSRRKRGMIGYVIVFVFSLALWGGGLGLQLKTAPTAAAGDDPNKHYYYADSALDMVSSGTKYAGPFVLYFMYGAFDALWQTLAYWCVAYLGHENDELAARYVGLYKSMQGVGAAIAWKVNAIGANYNLEFGLNWGFTTGALIIFFPFFLWIKENTFESEQDKPTLAEDAKA